MKTMKPDGVVDDLIKFALIALLVVVPIRLYVAQPFVVQGASMEPTFHGGEYLIVDQMSYRFNEPERGDVVIMRYPKDESIFFIKRIIGLPGETVELSGERVSIGHGESAEPFTLDESFLEPDRLQNQYGVYTLGSDEYFVMGDNRKESSDSRSWGALKRREIVGRAYLRLLPTTRIGVAPGEHSYEK